MLSSPLRLWLWMLLAPLILASCAVPPDNAYVAGRASRKTGSGIALGNDAAGKACEQQTQADGEAFIFCGEWAQPSAHVSSGPPGALADLASASAWRTRLDHRFDCAPPRASSMLGGEPALVLDCTRKIGGWPQVAVVVLVSGRAYFADGLQPELPAIERSIGILSGRLAPAAAATASPGAGGGLAAERLAAQTFSSNDIGQYEQLMAAGAIANRTQNYISAEKAYRAAYAVQQKILGPGNPNTASALMHQAVQLSNQGRYPEADALFARAEPLVNSPEISDKASRARLSHYRALNLINQDKLADALVLLAQAERDYALLLPAKLLTSRSAPAAGASGVLAERLADQDLLTDPVAEGALMGVIEMRRNRANIYKWMGRLPESQASAESAAELARARGWSQPVVMARLLRTSAEISRAEGHDDAALSALAQSATAFKRFMPGARPGADTELLRAAILVRGGRAADALDGCREAQATLQSLRAGTSTVLIEPCLAAYAAVASQDSGRAQALLAEMFEAAQLGQSGITSQQIARATARLAETARDPRVGEAIRRREDASGRLAELYRERDTLEAARRAGAQPNANAAEALDKKVAEALTAEADADTTLQVASPNYGQLVQQVVKTRDVLAILRPGEAFAATVLGDTSGWVFLLRDGKVAVAPIEGGAQRMGELVTRARAGIEPTSGSQPPAFDTQAALALYNAVLGGVARELDGATSLTVVPSGPLLSYPFAALLTGPAEPNALPEAPWLIRRMAVTHVPAAANFVALRKIAGGSRARNPWFGFGDFRPVSLKQAQASFPAGTCADSARLLAGLPLLPGARDELAQARAVMGAGASDELLGLAFTAAAVRQAALRDFRVLHFATHALLPTDLACEDEPAIVASGLPDAPNASGALLSASSVAQLQLDADAVILSACNTGGPNGGAAGESLSGLARSFFYAGARSLLVTHWPVNDQITRILVVNTLKNYHENPARGLAEALGDAQRGLIGQAKGDLAALAHPYYWAPLALIGESNPAGATAARVSSAHRLAGL